MSKLSAGLVICIALLPARAFPEEMRITGQLVKKYLPAHEIYAVDPYSTSNSRLMARTGDGNVLDLGRENDLYSRPLGKTRLVEFMASLGIPVSTAGDAVEVLLLIEYISTAPNKARMLRENTENYSIFDERLYQAFTCGDRYWEHTAEQQDGAWVISTRYTGPPACTIEPPVYFVQVDSSGKFAGLGVKDPI